MTTIGINLSGAEFGGANGTYGTSYHYPTLTELSYYAKDGVTLIRLPVKWEHLQPTLGGALSSDELGRLQTFLKNAQSVGVSVILDVHNYGRYHGDVIGSAAVPTSQFADLWGKLATALKGTPNLVGYDIMNEPHDMGSSSVWPAAAQAAVDAIRAVDMNTTIYVEGDHWSTASTWAKYNANLNIVDPANKLVYEAHQYFDHDSSGTYTGTYDQEGATATTGADRLKPFADWLASHNAHGFIGEFGAPSNDPRWLTVVDNFVKAMAANGIDSTAWGGGFWWSSSYALRLGGGSTGDSAEFNLLKTYMQGGSTSGGTSGTSTTPVPTAPADTVAPLAPSGLSDSSVAKGYVNAATNTAGQALTGTAEAGSTITIFDSTTKLGTTTASSTGAWTFTLGVLGQGAHSLTATATDAAGNVSVASSALKFKVDTSAPSAAVTSINEITNGLKIIGTSEPGSTVKLYDGSTLVGTAVTSSSGVWSVSETVLSSSAHNLRISTSDAAGNVAFASGDTLLGSAKDDVLSGHDFDDFLWGGSGQDTLNGFGGNDRLRGGAGNDTLSGGNGADTFVFSTAFGKDVVTDFAAGSDHLEVARSLFAKGSTDSQIFSYIVNHATVSGSNLVLHIDANDTITLNNVGLASLHASDFIFT